MVVLDYVVPLFLCSSPSMAKHSVDKHCGSGGTSKVVIAQDDRGPQHLAASSCIPSRLRYLGKVPYLIGSLEAFCGSSAGCNAKAV